MPGAVTKDLTSSSKFSGSCLGIWLVINGYKMWKGFLGYWPLTAKEQIFQEAFNLQWTFPWLSVSWEAISRPSTSITWLRSFPMTSRLIQKKRVLSRDRPSGSNRQAVASQSQRKRREEVKVLCCRLWLDTRAGKRSHDNPLLSYDLPPVN